MKKVAGEEVEQALKEVEDELYLIGKPKPYQGKKGIIVSTEKDYESNCVILMQKGISNPKEKTILEFYQAIEVIEKQNSHGNKGLKGRRSKSRRNNK